VAPMALAGAPENESHDLSLSRMNKFGIYAKQVRLICSPPLYFRRTKHRTSISRKLSMPRLAPSARPFLKKKKGCQFRLAALNHHEFRVCALLRVDLFSAGWRAIGGAPGRAGGCGSLCFHAQLLPSGSFRPLFRRLALTACLSRCAPGC